VSKLYRIPEVKLSPDGLPAAFHRRWRWYCVTSCRKKKQKTKNHLHNSSEQMVEKRNPMP